MSVHRYVATLCVSVCLSVVLSLPLSFCLSVSVSLCPFASMSASLSFCLSVCHSVSVCPSVCLSLCLSPCQGSRGEAGEHNTLIFLEFSRCVHEFSQVLTSYLEASRVFSSFLEQAAAKPSSFPNLVELSPLAPPTSWNNKRLWSS